MKHKVFVIAEAGVNHDGIVADALRLVDAAADAGADCVKFQTFDAASVASDQASKAVYQQRTTDPAESQKEMLQRLQLPHSAHYSLKQHAAKREIEFLSTPFDRGSLAFLVDELGLRKVKVGSGDLTNAPLLLEIARAGVSAVLSTGMATLSEIAEALEVLAFGYAHDGEPPHRAAFRDSWADPARRAALADRVTLLHCTTAYPTPLDSVNLLAIDTLRSEFGLDVGYSDHTLGIDIAIAAVARQANTIEKHLTLDRSRSGPDHAASLEPAEFKRMVEAIRSVETALGDGRKIPQPAEVENVAVARKSIVAAQRIAAGDRFDSANIACKRPGGGISPFEFWDLQSRIAAYDFEADDLIRE
jgi:N-acetylneuraminate synthase